MEEEVYQFSRANRTVWWPVRINVPQDEGDVLTITIQMKLSIPKKDEAKKAYQLPTDEFEKFMLERVLDWRGIVDAESKKPIAFSKKAFKSLLQDQYFEAGISAALVQAGMGVRAKN